jgi:hypothetical protein
MAPNTFANRVNALSIIATRFLSLATRFAQSLYYQPFVLFSLRLLLVLALSDTL